MPAIGGSIESVSLDGRNFAVAADAEAQRKLGGFENEVQANGDGNARLIKTRVPLSIDGLTIEVDDDRGDHEFLQDLSTVTTFFRSRLRTPVALRTRAAPRLPASCSRVARTLLRPYLSWVRACSPSSNRKTGHLMPAGLPYPSPSESWGSAPIFNK